MLGRMRRGRGRCATGRPPAQKGSNRARPHGQTHAQDPRTKTKTKTTMYRKLTLIALAAVAVLAAMHGAQAQTNAASSNSAVIASGVGPFTITYADSYVYVIDAVGDASAESYGVGLDFTGVAVAESIAESFGDFGFADTFSLAETLGLGTGFALAYSEAYTYAD